jgi:hypothetical protein
MYDIFEQLNTHALNEMNEVLRTGADKIKQQSIFEQISTEVKREDNRIHQAFIIEFHEVYLFLKNVFQE